MWYNYNAIDKEAGCFSAGKGIETMRKFGKLVWSVPYRDHFIEIRRGKFFFRAYILDKALNVVSWTPLYHEDRQELEFMARNRVDEIVDGLEHVIDNPMG